MRRNGSLLLLLTLVVTGAAPLSGERLVCPMPMSPKIAASCDACVPDSPAAADASLEAASCCRTAPATEADTVPATVSTSRRGGAPGPSDGGSMSVVLAECPAIAAQSVPSLDSPPPIQAAPPPLRSTQTTHLRN